MSSNCSTRYFIHYVQLDVKILHAFNRYFYGKFVWRTWNYGKFCYVTLLAILNNVTLYFHWCNLKLHDPSFYLPTMDVHFTHHHIFHWIDRLIFSLLNCSSHFLHTPHNSFDECASRLVIVALKKQMTNLICLVSGFLINYHIIKPLQSVNNR